MASVYKRASDGIKKGVCWYVAYTDEFGKRRNRKGFSDKGLTERLGAKIENEVMLRRRGIIDPLEEQIANQRKVSIEVHIDAYRVSLESRETTDKHNRLTLSRIRTVITGSRISSLFDVNEERVQKFLNEFRESNNLGHRTYNHYVQAFDGFFRWLIAAKRLNANPITNLARLNNAVDVRRKRRALTADEFVRLVEAARTSGEEIQCFDGETRARIYITSYLSGLRRKEIASLTPSNFSFASSTPTLTVEAACSKHRKLDVLPMHPQLAELVRGWIVGVPPTQPLFPRLAKRRTWLMVKKDLKRAKIAYKTSEGVADFHAAGRHTYITGLLQNGVSLVEAKELARHADVNMTMRYTHVGMKEQATAVAKLPSQERFRSAPGVSKGHSPSQVVTDPRAKTPAQETTNPCGGRGYVVFCQAQATGGTEACEWRRRELNPRPVIFPRRLLRA